MTRKRFLQLATAALLTPWLARLPTAQATPQAQIAVYDATGNQTGTFPVHADAQHDDTANIQRAFNNVPSNGTIRFPVGTMRISNTVTFPPGTMPVFGRVP